MSAKENSEKVVKAIENFMEKGKRPEDMGPIGHLFANGNIEISLVREKILILLFQYDLGKIKQTLDLIEYLTVISPEKMGLLMNDQKIVERISMGLFEYDLTQQILALLKLFSDKFEDRKSLLILFEFINGLGEFGYEMPISYSSRFEGAKFSPEAMSDEKQQEPGFNYDKLNLKDLVEKAKNLKLTIKGFLDKCDFDTSMTVDQKISKVRAFSAELEAINQALNIHKTYDLWDDVRPRVEPPLNELFDLRPILAEKIVFLTEQSKNSSNQPLPQPCPQPNSDSQQNLSSKNDKMMDLDELRNYKVMLCPKGQTCVFAPKLDIKRYKFGEQNEYLCSYWHNHLDRRRPLCDEVTQEFNYTINTCKFFGGGCNEAEKCTQSHNFYESHFHPRKYKRNRCNNNPNGKCKYGKFCPFYHNMNEKEMWKTIIESNYVFPEDDDYDQYFGPRDRDDIELGEMGPQNRKKHHLNPDHPPRNDPNVAINMNLNDYSVNIDIHSAAKDHNTAHFEVKKEYIGKLSSILKIKGNYEKPDKLTLLFLTETNHNGYPLFVGDSIQKNEDY